MTAHRRAYVEVFEIQTAPRTKGAEVVKVKRKAHGLTSDSCHHGLAIGPCAEQRLAQTVCGGIHRMQQLLELRQLADQFQ